VLQLYSGNNTGIDVVWVSPEFSDLDSNNRWVKFGSVTNLSSAATNPVRMAVGTMSNPSDPSSWVSLGDTVVMNTQYGWVNSVVPLTSVPAGHKYIGLKYVSTSTFVSIFLDNFVYEKIPSCPEPTGVNISSITSNSASVSWTSNSTGTSWQLSYSPTPFANPAAGTKVISTATTYNLTGLLPSTQYGVYVREICSAVDTSNWSIIGVFNTSCPVAFNAPYFTDFSPVGIQQTGALPNCWNVLPGPTSTSFTWRGEEGTGVNKNSLNTGPLWDNTQFGTAGGKYIYLETSSGTANDTARLISPIIVVSGLTTPMLSFYYHMHGATMGSLYTLVRTKGGPWIAIDTISGQQQLIQSDPWINRSLVLPPSLGDSIQIKFLGSRGTSFTGDMSLDDISVIQAPTCPAPNSLSSSGITSNAATLNWNSNATGNTWQISYGPAPISGPQAGTIVLALANPFNLTGLTPATQYCYYVREICGPGDTSAWSTSHCFVTACVPYAMPFLEDFQSWTVGSDAPLCFNSAGGLQKWDRFVSGTNIVARANFWSFNAPNDFKLTSPQIIVSSAAELQYKWSHLYSSTYPDDALYILGRTVGATVWDTLVAQKGPTFNSNDGAANTTPGSFVWDTVTLNPTWVGQNIEIQLHGVSDFGPSVFIDSLSVVPVGGVSCPAPTSLASANIVCDAFDVSFTSNSGTSYVEYGATGFAPGTGTVVSPAASPVSINGLMANSGYDVYVYDICTGDTSMAAGPLAVTTASGPQPVAAFTWVVTPTLVDATVVFDASGSSAASTYTWDFGNSTTGTGVNASGVYTSNGTYNVTLIVSNACGSDTLTEVVTVSGIGVAEAALAASFQAYPNPTHGKVTLSFSLMHSHEARVEVMDLSGRVVWMESAEVNGTYRKELDLSAYAAGVYLVRVSSEDGVVSRRLVVE
jgi:PKD repeat protein